MAALRPLTRLRALTLAGNPAAAGPGARAWALAHLPGLAFLDHARVSPADRAAVRERFQARARLRAARARGSGLCARARVLGRSGALAACRAAHAASQQHGNVTV